MPLMNDRHITIVSVTAPLSPATISIENATGWTIALVTGTNPLHSASGEIGQVTLPTAEIGDVIEMYRTPIGVGEGAYPPYIECLPPPGETFFGGASLQLAPATIGVFFRRIAADKWAWMRSSPS